MNTSLVVPEVAYWTVAPVLILAGAAALILLVTAVRSRPLPASWHTLVTVGAATASLIVTVAAWDRINNDGPLRALAGAVVVDGFSLFLTAVIVASLAVATLLAEPWLRREGLEGPEFSVLALLCASGGVVMAQANDLIVLFLGLEILSIALYVMAGFQVDKARSREAAMKYFVLGAFSSALFLYGIALVYGATGSTQLHEIVGWLSGNVGTTTGVLLAGVMLLLVGLGFKVAAVPFHAWTPDVYEGSPTPVTGFMAAVAKAAGFAGLLRVFYVAFSTLRFDWQPVVLVLALLTIVVGSVAAVVQDNVKRILAYSSIAHAGYVLIGLQVASPQGLSSALFYLFAYAFMVLGSFGVVTLVARRGDEGHAISDYRGLARRRPGLALSFTVFLLAQAGVPFTSGFLAKFYVVGAAVEAGSYVLGVLAMLGAAIAAFVYLRVVLAMYSGGDPEPFAVYSGPGEHDLESAEEDEVPARIQVPVLAGAALGLCLVITLAAGILPGPLLDWARQATLFV